MPSVGLARIINDPKASILTRKALGALSNPNLLVTDKGLTIDNDGRMVLRLASGAGLSEDNNGLSVKLAPNGGLVVDTNGLAVADLANITCNTITVNTTATVGTTLTAGAVVSTSSVSGVSANFSGNGAFASTTITGAMNAGNGVFTGSVTAGSTAISGALTAGSGVISGALTAGSAALGSLTATSASISGGLSAGSASISGLLTAGSFAPSSVNTGSLNAISATIIGTLSAGSFNPSSISTGLITCTDLTAGSGQLQGGGIRIGGGTTMTRLRSYFAEVTLPITIGPHEFLIYTPGAKYQDGVLVTGNQTGVYTRGEMWCGSCDRDNYVAIRVDCTGGSARTLYFRIVIFGFL